MQIISFLFFGFVAAIFLLLYIVNKRVKNPQKSNSTANWILLVSSYLFILYADWRFCLVLALLTIATWYFALDGKKGQIGILIALGVLIFFKYTNFFAASFSDLFGKDYTVQNLILPIGISFYTFSAIGYIVDVKRKKTACRSLREVALYLAFFPKLTSGPIQKSDDFFRQMEKKREIGWNSFEPGIQIFVFGLFKKLVLADRLSVFVNQVYKTPLAFGSMTVFFAAVAYSLQIYFDFSGYSDMAVGIAKILGFTLPKNFNLPYLSHNVTEFWKRWHITLSTWLQDYLYISLGGSRKGRKRTYLNLLLTMLLGGIWHGANWTFLAWGGGHAVALSIHKVWMRVTKSDQEKSSGIASGISIVITFLYVTFLWIFFRAESLSQAVLIIRRIFEFRKGLEQPYLWLFVSLVLLAVCSILAYQKSKSSDRGLIKKNVSVVCGYYPLVNLSEFWGLVWFFVFCGSLICLAYTGGSPFIYGQY